MKAFLVFGTLAVVSLLITSVVITMGYGFGTAVLVNMIFGGLLGMIVGEL